MIVFSSSEVRARLVPLLTKTDLPVRADISSEDVEELVSHDKKARENGVVCVCCDRIGTYDMRRYTAREIAKAAQEAFGSEERI